jgi:hypothetical protein
MAHLLTVAHPPCLLLQEARGLSSSMLPGYTTFTAVSSTRRGGAAIAFRRDLTSQHLPVALPDADVVAALLHVDTSPVLFISAYFFIDGDIAATLNALGAFLSQYQHTPTVLAFDANAHDPLWDERSPDERGALLADFLSMFHFEIGNTGVATRIASHQLPTSPDVSASSRVHILDWTAHISGCSDHHILTFSVATDAPDDLPYGPVVTCSPPPLRCFNNWDKANWDLFGEIVTARLQGVTSSFTPYQVWTAFSEAIQEATRVAIPRGASGSYDCSATLRTSLLNDETYRTLTSALDEDPTNPVLRKCRRDHINSVLRASWHDRVTSLSPSDRSSWRVLRSIKSNPSPSIHSSALVVDPPHPPLTSSTFIKPRDKANVLVKHFFPRYPDVAPISHRRHSRNPPLTDAEFRHAFRHVHPGRAAGVDEIFPEHLLHLPPRGLAVFRRLVHLCIVRNYIPPIWKKGLVIPLPKPGRPPTDLSAWRPVTLTSVVCKFVERILSERLLETVTPLLSPSQFGFLPTRSTADANFSLTDMLLSHFNMYSDVGRPDNPNKSYFTPWKTLSTFYDLTSAYDRVPHSTLLKKLTKMHVAAPLRAWITNFLSSRTVRVCVGAVYGRSVRCNVGVPQGSVLSPILFAIFINDLLTSVAPHAPVFAFADDVSVHVAAPRREDCDTAYEDVNRIVSAWCASNNMLISSKTKQQFFTRSTHLRPTVAFPAATPAVLKPPKCLGLVFDYQLTFIDHVDMIIASVSKRITQLRCIANATFGPTTASLRVFFLTYIAPLLSYCVETFYPLLSDKQQERLDVVDRRALRVVTGLPVSTPTAALYCEAGVLPLSFRVRLLVARRFEKALRYPPFDIRQPPPSTIPQVSQNYQPLHHDPTLTDLARQELRHVPHDNMSPLVSVRPFRIAESVEAQFVSFGLQVIDSEDSAEKLKHNTTTFTALISSFSPRFLITSDASVLPDRSAGGAVMFARHGADWLELERFSRRTGVGTCSFQAEAITIAFVLSRLTTALKCRSKHRHRKHILFLTDSLSFLSELNTGPIRCKTHLEYQQAWLALMKLSRMGYSVHLQFMYAHCDFHFNDIADEFAKKSNDTLPLLDDTPLWITDAVRHYFQSLDPPSVRTPSDSLPREDAVRLSRLRVGESLEVGKLLRRLGALPNMACRWCSSDHIPAPPQPLTPSRVRRSLDPFVCPYCPLTLCHAKAGRYHVLHLHPDRPLPPELIPSGAHGRGSGKPLPAVTAPVPNQNLSVPDGAEEETVEHVLVSCLNPHLCFFRVYLEIQDPLASLHQDDPIILRFIDLALQSLRTS